MTPAPALVARRALAGLVGALDASPGLWVAVGPVERALATARAVLDAIPDPATASHAQNAPKVGEAFHVEPTRHLIGDADGEAVALCCGRGLGALDAGDRFTTSRKLVTCQGARA